MFTSEFDKLKALDHLLSLIEARLQEGHVAIPPLVQHDLNKVREVMDTKVVLSAFAASAPPVVKRKGGGLRTDYQTVKELKQVFGMDTSKEECIAPFVSTLLEARGYPALGWERNMWVELFAEVMKVHSHGGSMYEFAVWVNTHLPVVK